MSDPSSAESDKVISCTSPCGGFALSLRGLTNPWLRFRLAYCELYVTLGTFFRRFHNLKVFETTPADMEYDDFFSSFAVNGSKVFKATSSTIARG